MYHLIKSNNIFHHLKAIILLLLFTNINLQAQQFTPTTLDGKSISTDQVEALISNHKKQYIDNELEGNTETRILSLITLSQLSRTNLNYSDAFDFAGEALFIAEEYGNSKLLSLALQENGLLNYLFKQDKQAQAYFTASLTYAKKAYQQGNILHQELYPAYYHALLYSQRIEDLQGMQAYLDTCKAFIEEYKWGNEKQIYINEKQAFLDFRQDKQEKALQLLHEAGSVIENKKTLLAHHSFLIVIYGVIANDLIRMQRNGEAMIYFEKALNIPDQWGENTFYLEYLHTTYAHQLFLQGNTKKAYLHMLQGKKIDDSFLNPRKDATQDLLSVKNRYREELDQRNERLRVQTLEIAEQKTKLWQIRVFFSFVILILTITLFLTLRIRQQQKHRMENKIFLERRHHNEELIEHNNKELTANMLQLIEKEEIIKKLSEVLKKEAPNKKVQPLLKSIAQQSTSLWDAFNTRFMEQNTDFYEHLKEIAPNLSAADLKICALIKLNFSGKEMAYLLGISEGSIHVARHRLRKKFKMGREVNLVQFINTL